jgi:hypothetical protein
MILKSRLNFLEIVALIFFAHIVAGILLGPVILSFAFINFTFKLVGFAPKNDLIISLVIISFFLLIVTISFKLIRRYLFTEGEIAFTDQDISVRFQKKSRAPMAYSYSSKIVIKLIKKPFRISSKTVAMNISAPESTSAEIENLTLDRSTIENIQLFISQNTKIEVRFEKVKASSAKWSDIFYMIIFLVGPGSTIGLVLFFFVYFAFLH